MEEKSDISQIFFFKKTIVKAAKFWAILNRKRMWPNHKLIHPSAQLLQTPTPPPPLPPSTQTPGTTAPLPPPIVKQCFKFSRRELAICTNSSLLLLLGSQTLEPLQFQKARAEEIPEKTSSEEGVAEEVQENTENASSEEQGAVEIQEKTEKTSPEELGAEEIQQKTDEIQENNEKTSPEEVGVEEIQEKTDKTSPEEPPKKIDYCEEQSLTNRAFLDVAVDGKPIGRIVIGLYGERAPFGTSTFSDLVSGAAGISYRRKEFIKIMPNYVQHGGVRSYGVDADLARNAGKNLASDRLMDEWEKQYQSCPGTKNLATTVGIVVRDPSKPPPKLKLVARKGKLEIDQEEVGVAPNGTEFVISIKDSPELDASTLVVGRVLEGIDVVEKIGQVKTVQENTSSPYFRYLLLVSSKKFNPLLSIIIQQVQTRQSYIY